MISIIGGMEIVMETVMVQKFPPLLVIKVVKPVKKKRILVK